KITPRPDEGVAAMLQSAGFEDTALVTTSKHSHAAPFVNAEEAQYLVIEDSFPNGRPALEKAGVLFTERAVVEKVEKMKVGTCLNPLHTALAVFGCLLGYTKISEEMKDEHLVKLIEQIGYGEGLPVVVNPGIIDPKDFIAEVLNVRFPNPFMPDTPQRIACDTSQKIPIRFGETLKAYIERGMDVESLRAIPLVFAAWLRYLLGVDDEGKPFTPSPDPMLETLQSRLAGITLGSPGDCREKLRPILSNPTYFGIDLYKGGLGEMVEDMFIEMTSAPGAVRKALANLVDNG
ncbi:MAG: mannitol dehydrogenase family protein, partial [Defluviitaleaceae bacterium]|nr:mannitol dehydrogenase family protein [Defluviitaleaceae bacterium]